MNSNNPRSKTSPWVYVGCGCAAVVILIAVAIAAASYLGFKQVRQIEKEMKDPVARDARAKQILGARDLPEGYHPLLGMSVPFLMEMAILSDRELDSEGEVDDLGDRGFLFIAIRAFGKTEREIRDYFEGKTDRSDVVSSHVDIDFDEELDRGEIVVAGNRWLWVAQRGELENGRHREQPVVASLLMLECGREKRLRFGLWFMADPDPDAPSPELDLSGTPADEAALGSFLSHFHPCSEVAD